MKASSLKGKHVQTLLDRWQGEGLSSGTIKNRLSHLRWWAEKVGKSGILPADNTQLGVAERRYVTNISKARALGIGLEQVTDAHVRMSLQLQAAFGLRREEAITPQLVLDVVAVLLGLLAANGGIAAGLLGLDHCHGFAVFAEQDVVAELVALVGRARLGHAHWQGGEDVEFLDNLGRVFDVPA